MEILQAYCVELDRIVDIYEAQEAFFALPPVRRKRYTFRCSGDACRAANKPLVSGVNYDKLAEETEKYRQIHFRAPVGHPHIDTCVWVQGHRQRSADGDTDDDGDRHPRIERAKATHVIDVFDPKDLDPLIAASLGTSTTKPPVDPDPTDIDASGGVRAHDGYSSTTRLERFIDCWSQFEGDELKHYQITVEGRTLSYRQAVLRPNWITQEENGARIVYGGARVKLWPDDKPNRLYINFMDECEKLPEHEGSRSLTIDLSLSRIHACRGGALLMQRIEQAQVAGYYLRVYCWGPIKKRDQRPGYIVEITSLDNLVCKVIPKKPVS